MLLVIVTLKPDDIVQMLEVPQNVCNSIFLKLYPIQSECACCAWPWSGYSSELSRDEQSSDELFHDEMS